MRIGSADAVVQQTTAVTNIQTRASGRIQACRWSERRRERKLVVVVVFLVSRSWLSRARSRTGCSGNRGDRPEERGGRWAGAKQKARLGLASVSLPATRRCLERAGQRWRNSLQGKALDHQ